jgi:hypothetical protein
VWGNIGRAKEIMEKENGFVLATHRVARWIGGILFLATGLALPAQSTLGPVAVLRTGGGTLLDSATQSVGSFSAGVPASFQFQFAFGSSTEPTTWALLVTAVVFFFAFQWRSE